MSHHRPVHSSARVVALVLPLLLISAACSGSSDGPPPVAPRGTLAFQVQPSDVLAGAAISPAVQVAALAADGSIDATADGEVALAIGDDPGGATLTGATGTLIDGVATFADLRLDASSSGYTLVASAPGMESATCEEFDVVEASVSFTARTSTGAEEREKLAVLIELTLSAGELPIPVTARISDAGTGSATSFVDYAMPATVEIPFAAGTPSGATESYTLRILDDQLFEGTETIVLDLSAASEGLTIGARPGHEVTIVDDERPAKITFPARSSLTDAPRVTVRGVTDRAVSATSITVNGVPATSSNSFADWSADVQLTAGANLLRVDLEANQQLYASVDTVTVENRPGILYSPSDVAFDAANGRAYVLEWGEPALVGFDLGRGVSRTVVSSARRGQGPALSDSRGLALDLTNNRALITDRANSGRLFAVDLTTGDRQILSENLSNTGPEFRSPVGITLDAVNEVALISDVSLGALFSVDLGTGIRTIISDSNTGTGPDLVRPYGVVLDAANRRALVIDGNRSSGTLFSVSLADGDRTVISDASTGRGPEFEQPSRVALEPGGQRAMVADPRVQALFAVDLANGDRSIVWADRQSSSPRTGPTGLTLGPTAIAVDPGGNRALVADSLTSALRAIDLGSGIASTLVQDTIGDGIFLSFPRDIALDASEDRMLVPDFYHDAVMAVDMLSGRRTILSDQTKSSSLQRPSAVAASGQRLLVGTQSGTLFLIDGASGALTDLSAMGTGGAISNFSDLCIDEAMDVALVVDAARDALFIVDLKTGDRTEIASGTVGTGAALSDLFVAALDMANGRALTFTAGTLVAADLAPPWNRTVLDPAVPSIGQEGLELDARNDRLITRAHGSTGLVSYDLSAKRVSTLSSLGTGDGPLFRIEGLALTPDGETALVVDGKMRAVLWVDLQSGDRVVVSH